MRALVIRYRKLGDSLMATPILQGLAALGETFVVGEAPFERVFTGVPGVRGFVAIGGPEPSRWELVRAGAAARRFRCDTALVLRFNRRSGIVARLAGCGVRIGGTRSGWNGITGLTQNVYDPAVWPSSHQVEKYYAVAEAAVGELPRVPTFYAPCGGPPSSLPSEYVVVHVGNGGSNLAWPDDQFAQTIRMLQAQNLKVIVTGAPDAKEYAQARVAGDLDLVGNTNLDEIGALFQRARVVVGLDGGGPRLASAVGTPTVVLSIGERWNAHQASPWMAPGVVVRSPVEPEAVVAATWSLLRG